MRNLLGLLGTAAVVAAMLVSSPILYLIDKIRGTRPPHSYFD